MKISELSSRSGVTIASIKYYIREGLLPAGDTQARNQAVYSEQHVADLALIRALRERAKLSISAIRRVLAAVASSTSEGPDTLEASFESVQKERMAERTAASDSQLGEGDNAGYRQAWQDLKLLFEARGWNHQQEDSAVQELLAAMTAVCEVWPYGKFDPSVWENYAALGEQAASFEIPSDWDPDRFPAEALRYAIVGTYLFEPVILAFRRIALTERSIALQAERRSEVQGGDTPTSGASWLSTLSTREPPPQSSDS